MAKVKIKVPNIGEIEADNFATEETLLKLLAAISKTEKDKKAAENAALKKAQDDEIKALKLFNKTVKDLTDTEKKQLEAERKREVEEDEAHKRSIDRWENRSKSLATTLGSLGKSAISLAAQMATQYDAMAQDPIGAAAGQLNTFIDATNTAAKGAVDLGTGLLGSIPGFGSFAEGLDKAAKAALDLAAALLKTANDIFAKEFKKSTEALASYTKQGASFAGGMLEMRQVANDAGLSLKTLSDAAAKSSEDIRAAGLTQGEGAKMIAKGMGDMTKKFGGATASARDELLALGYSYQDQAELMASYGAQVKATGRDMKNIAPEQLQREMKDYAVNLKVISDITGQDAKKLMDKARQESMRGALMGKLDAKQQEAYKSSYAAMMAMGPEMGPKLQQALTQVMAGGPVTDPIIAGNKDIMDMINKTAGQVSEGNAEMAVNTQKNLSEAGKAMKDHGENATDQAVLFGGAVDGVVSGMAQMQNAFKAFQLDPDAAENSKKAAKSQMDLANSADSVEAGFAKVTTAAQDLAKSMEETVGKHLGEYATVLGDTMKKTTEAFQTALEYIASGFDPKVLAINEEKKKQAEIDAQDAANAKAATWAEKLFSTHYIDIGLEKLSTGLGSALESAGAKTVGSWFKSLGNTAQESRVNSESDYLKSKGKEKFATGGITNKSAIFGEDGPEAAVPLPDGKTIPVTLKDISTKKHDNQSEVLNTVASAQETSLKLIDGAQAEIAKLAQSSIATMKGMSESSVTGRDDLIQVMSDMTKGARLSIKDMLDSLMPKLDKNPMEASMGSFKSLLGDITAGLDNIVKNNTPIQDGANDINKRLDRIESEISKANTALSQPNGDTWAAIMDKMSAMHDEVMDKHDAMIGHLRDNNDTGKKILNASM